MSQFININSQLDALRIKEFEEKFYEKISDNVKIVPKVTPFKGINTDLLYIKDNKILFVKCNFDLYALVIIIDRSIGLSDSVEVATFSITITGVSCSIDK